MRNCFLMAATAACLFAGPAQADTTLTITTNRNDCKVSRPDDVATPVSPSVAAGQDAMRNRNYALAAANFKPLAESGKHDAERAYGNLLITNCTGLQDKAAALGWLTKAADADDVVAQTQLGQAYMNGNGAAQDDAKAFALLSKAALAGNVNAEKSLGYLYLSGRGTEQDRYQGMVWSVKAGEQGDAIALSNIAGSYLQGNGLPQDNEKAAYYIAIAVARIAPGDNVPNMLRNRTAIARRLSQDEMQAQAKEAKNWKPGTDSLMPVLRDADKVHAKMAKN
jgi:hypothetical protein